MVDGMTITEALVQRVQAALDATGWTWKEVQAHGGPSSTTMTGLNRGRVGKPISLSTMRKLDTAFGWPRGTARRLVDPSYTPPAAPAPDVSTPGPWPPPTVTMVDDEGNVVPGPTVDNSGMDLVAMHQRLRAWLYEGEQLLLQGERLLGEIDERRNDGVGGAP